MNCFDDIDLADAEFASYSFEAWHSRLVVKIWAWNASLIEYEFLNIIFCRGHGSFFLKAAVECKATTPELHEVLLERYGQIPEEHPFRHVRFIDLDDEVGFEVVFSKVELRTYPLASLVYKGPGDC